jgi:hypothetical protein
MLRKKIEEKILGLPERIVKTDNGDLMVNTIGTKLVHVYNLHKKRSEKYALKDFAFFALGQDWNVDIFEELLSEAFEDYLAWEKARDLVL